MQKDVLYIDVEDDITAIIGKVKAAKQKVVALVPPKRVGAIQSAVNLKLVQRAATHEGKQLVMISKNAALVALASNAGIPVAKNLQSKPEMPEIPVPEIDEGEAVSYTHLDVYKRQRYCWRIGQRCHTHNSLSSSSARSTAR